MPWRRAILLLLATTLAVAALSAPRSGPGPRPAPRPAAPAPAPFRATMPADGPVRVPAGRLVELRVTSLQPDIARIDALGLHAPVGPAIDGPTLTFAADSPGRYPVRFDVAGTTVGTLEVVAPADEG